MIKGIEHLPVVSADSILSSQEERDDAKLEKVVHIKLSEIDPFFDHPFKAINEDEMNALVESISEFGVISAALVRPKADGRYEQVIGHRRKKACELAGLEALPCIVREMSDDEAIIAVVDSNLHRERILPSEKAKAYKMKLDAIKRQGKRTDLTSTPMVSKLRTNELVGLANNESREQVRRHIRLTELVPELINMVDSGRLAIRVGVELSYIPQELQKDIASAVVRTACVPTQPQAIKIRKLSEEEILNIDKIMSIIQKKPQKPVPMLKIPQDKISRFFPKGTTEQVIEDTIIIALELLEQQKILVEEQAVPAQKHLSKAFTACNTSAVGTPSHS